ncbi:MAG TPA: hypothetical protein VNX25_01980 [Verrucomicrobiae bacterium]|nr:hypothetical protein [Verrucomicrobiae bacterium]
MLKRIFIAALLLAAAAGPSLAAGDYRGDARCPLPTDWSRYSEPYEPLDHPGDYPTFPKADVPGWSCSYQRSDGIIVQYGDSRTPQQQWLDTWTPGNDHND